MDLNFEFNFLKFKLKNELGKVEDEKKQSCFNFFCFFFFFFNVLRQRLCSSCSFTRMIDSNGRQWAGRKARGPFDREFADTCAMKSWPRLLPVFFILCEHAFVTKWDLEKKKRKRNKSNATHIFNGMKVQDTEKQTRMKKALFLGLI